jgi:hypothetical protein
MTRRRPLPLFALFVVLAFSGVAPVAPITLKALANFSPGFALKPWDKRYPRDFSTLKELRRICDQRSATQLLQSCIFHE